MATENTTREADRKTGEGGWQMPFFPGWDVLDVPPEKDADGLRTSPVVSSFLHSLHCSLSLRMPEQGQMVVSLSDDMMVYRRAAARDPEEPIEGGISLEGGAFGNRTRSRWRHVTRFQSLLEQALQESRDLIAELEWNQASLPVDVFSAAAAAQRLLEQCGDPAARDIGVDRLRAEERAYFHQCLEGAKLERKLIAGFGRGLAERIRRGPDRESGRGDPPGAAPELAAPRFLLLTAGRVEIDVQWLTAAGGCLRRESLGELILRLGRQQFQDLVWELGRRRTVKAECERKGRGALDRLSPRIAAACRLALDRKTTAGVRVAVSSFKRPHGTVPFDLWLYPQYDFDRKGSACILDVYRPHREFILQKPGGRSFYYFPPVQIVARLAFRNNMVYFYTPRIRMPRNGYRWVHPYTGTLHPAPFAPACSPERLPDDVMYAHSPEAETLFPFIKEGPSSRIALPQEGDLCLAGQDDRIGELVRDWRPDGGADMLSTVWQICELGRLGLVRSHQLNHTTPRVGFDDTRLPYPMRGRTIPEALLPRTFPFDPNVPVSQAVAGERGRGGSRVEGRRHIGEFLVNSEYGISAHQAARFVKTSSRFDSEIKVSCGDAEVSGKSIMGLLTLEVASGMRITITAEGPDAAGALEALGQLVESGFAS